MTRGCVNYIMIRAAIAGENANFQMGWGPICPVSVRFGHNIVYCAKAGETHNQSHNISYVK